MHVNVQIATQTSLLVVLLVTLLFGRGTLAVICRMLE
jgi:hypothetical protein